MGFDFQEYIRQMEEKAKNNKVGENYLQGIWKGIDLKAQTAVTALKNVYVELETLSKDAEKNAARLQKKRQERELKNLKNSLDLRLITETDYYKKLIQYRDANVKKGSDLWYEISDEVVQYNKKMLDQAEKEQRERREKMEKEQREFQKKVKKINEDFVERLKDTDVKLAQDIAVLSRKAEDDTAEIQRMFLERMDAIQSGLAENLRAVENEWVESFRIRFIGINDNGSDLIYNVDKINDFKEEINTLERFYSTVLKLKKFEYFPDDFFAEIGQMDVETATKMMEKLLVASDEKRREFAENYTLKNMLAEQIAIELNGVLNKSEIENAKAEAAEQIDGIINDVADEKNLFIKELQENFSDIPKEYYELGSTSASALGEGFISGLEKTMHDARIYFLDIINSFAEDFNLKMDGVRDGIVGTSSNIYNNSYTFNSSKNTTTEQLAAAKAAATLEKLRGGN